MGQRAGRNGGRRAIFLDRDGTINVEVGYIRRREDIRLIPGSGAAIRALNRAGWIVIVITNQSGVSRGYLPADELEAAHERLIGLVRDEGGVIDAVYVCPHHPDDGCDCRKPEPALIERAIDRFGIDPAASWMVGDKQSDIQLARNAGCRSALVLTGYGPATLGAIDPAAADLIAVDLATAVRHILTFDGARSAAAEG
jgi:D-glycero-D-manno-heptose 1,7-bisphosphate phosphatase